jgi:hypothetical protein
LHVAAALALPEAFAALSYRYEHGIGSIERDVETAAFYAWQAADAAGISFHATGAQPVVQADRIDDTTVLEILHGNTGEDDAAIQFQMVRAAEGHLPSVLAMGDLYYFGARGMPRDQTRALQVCGFVVICFFLPMSTLNTLSLLPFPSRAFRSTSSRRRGWGLRTGCAAPRTCT